MDSSRARLAAQELVLQASAHLAPVLFHGKSMLPFFEDGDELTVEPVAWDDIRPGDIITYRLDHRFPTCRVLEKKGEHVLLTTDNWRWANFEAWREDVLGRVVARTRGAHVLRHTDFAWVRHTQALLFERRARRAGSRMRAKAARARVRLRDRWLRWREGYTELPTGIQLNVSARCNLRCRMCPYLEVHTDPNVERFMKEETFARLLPALEHIGSVTFSGAGEPLFNKQLLHFMDMTRRASPRIEMDVTSNATMLTREFAEELIRLRVRRLNLSLDGAHPETVQAIRRGIPHSRVLENIRMVKQRKQERQSNYPILMINYMMGYGTYQEFVDFIPLAREMGVSEIQVLEMQPATAEDYAENLANSMERDRGRLLREAIKRASLAGIRIYLPGVVENACRHPYTPHIGEDGEVYPCCYLDYDGRKLYSEGEQVHLPRLSFGNINHTSFLEIWNSPAYVELRRRDNVGDFPDYCRTCYNVRAESAHTLNRILGPR